MKDLVKIQKNADGTQAVKELTEQKNALNKRLRYLKMRIDENEATIYAPYKASIPQQTELASFQQMQIVCNHRRTIK